MKPIVKYQGGKTKELPKIKALLPNQVSRVVEPFCGGAAVTFAFQNTAYINDFNAEVINLYNVVANPELFPRLYAAVEELKTYTHNTLETQFYTARDIINTPGVTDPYTRALSYIIVRQLCFSGMERYNSSGAFNVPFGHYQRFSCNLSIDHHTFLKDMCTITHGTFVDVFPQITATDFVFIDPPYLERLGYTDGDGGLPLHTQLADCLKHTTAKWMIVHSDHEFYRDTYKEYNIVSNAYVYSQRFGKGKNHSNAKVEHLYITNYDTNNFF